MLYSNHDDLSDARQSTLFPHDPLNVLHSIPSFSVLDAAYVIADKCWRMVGRQQFRSLSLWGEGTLPPATMHLFPQKDKPLKTSSVKAPSSRNATPPWWTFASCYPLAGFLNSSCQRSLFALFLFFFFLPSLVVLSQLGLPPGLQVPPLFPQMHVVFHSLHTVPGVLWYPVLFTGSVNSLFPHRSSWGEVLKFC